MTFSSKSVLLAASLALAACSHYSDDLSAVERDVAKYPVMAQASQPQDIAPAAGGGLSLPATPGDRTVFAQALAKGYCDMARYENDKAYDYKAAKIFTEKAVMASKGKIVPPAQLSKYDLPQDRLVELKQARADLTKALKDPATVEGNQDALAKAQTSFDCWAERAEEATDETHYAQCKGEFEQAMASVITPAAGGGFAVSGNAVDIAFAQNSAALDNTAIPSIEQVAAILSSPQASGYTIILTGFTDTSVPSGYATQLATRRVFAVRDALVAKGVADSRIKPQISGAPGLSGSKAASLSPVSLNRRVQIFLSAPAENGFVPVNATTTIW